MTKAAERGVLREIRLRIRSRRPGAVEIIKDILAGNGIPRQELVELTNEKYQCLLYYPKTSGRARHVRRLLKDLDCPGVMLETKVLSKKEWQDRWKEDFKPFALGKNFFVIPLGWPGGIRGWQKKYKTGERDLVVIDPAMAFGSGLHETTRFMVQLIESCRGSFEHFLDIGTGTGILSIAAAKCGAKQIDGIDFNPDCVKVARGNLRRNSCRASSLKVADIHHYPSRKRYDLVAANLVTHNLVRAARKLASLVRSEKYLAVSGVSLENVPVLKKAFRKYPLRPLKIIKGKEWAAVLYKKYKRT